MIATSEVGVSMTIDNVSHLAEIVEELKKYGTVTVDENMCIVREEDKQAALESLSATIFGKKKNDQA